jgi:hypothetical protein
MNTDSFRAQVRELLAGRQHSATQGAEVGRGICVPLRLSGDRDLAVLAELIRRVAASPALAAAQAAGLLRFELSIDPAMPPAAVGAGAQPARAACCDDCARGDVCRCDGTRAAAPIAPSPAMTPVLRGVITERDVKALPADCRVVSTAPRAVLTPLARDALRQRGIAVHSSKEA